MDKLAVVGKGLPRFDAYDKITGRAKYCIDLKMENMLHTKMLRSPYPHARVVSINTERAERHPGVRAVATINEVPKIVGMWWSLRTEKGTKKMYLHDNIVRFVGDPVAAVAATDELSAMEALSLIEVEYEELPALFNPLEAMESETKIHERGNVPFHTIKDYGNIEEGFAEADFIYENTYYTSKQKHASIEPIGSCIASYDGGKLTVYSSTQLPHWVKMYIAGAMGLSFNNVRIIKPYTGGAFGGRCGVIHGLETMCCFLSKKAGSPVKMSFTREEDLATTESRHPFIVKMKTGVTNNGTLTATSIKIIQDVGGYATHNIGVIADALSTGVGLYRCPHVRFEGYSVHTNKSLCGAFRGYGNPQINFAQEAQMDMIAENIGMDPVELRLKNYRGTGEIDPVFDEAIQSCGLQECLNNGAQTFDWTNKRINKNNSPTKKRGVGVSCLTHGTGARFGLPDPASAIVMFNVDGTINLATAAADDGQGNRTALAQIAAEELGIKLEQVFVNETDTDTTPIDGGTHGSRQTYCGGLAVQQAAQKAKKNLLRFASEHLKADEKELQIKEGVIYKNNGTDTCVSIADLLRKIGIEDLSVCEQIIGVHTGVAPGMPPSFGANFAEVEVDTETGQVKVLKLVCAFDVGKAINPTGVKGQIAGGAVMGIGFALSEDLILENGKIMNDNFDDYKIMTACDVPEIEPIIVESNEPTGPYGAKGVGESTMIGIAGAIANAVYNAAGIRVTELPITQEKILRALKNS